MMRISGVNIPDNKRLEVALTYIFGVGPTASKNIIKSLKLDKDKRAKTLTQDEVGQIQQLLESSIKVEGDLRQEIKQNIARLKEIKSYRGNRHSKNLPLRGQRTRRNTRTVRGNVRKTVGSGKRKVELK
ncbi:MAG: 30S ribosomal protein S13 [Candidatus Liptonbacteria bacterium CG11_big_fil_rev_8_21_14_0_20_35_14]|uniref:Small ribosomal subunit protein uS13 n=1 Tax=Candidatus Liptonbacteria bacterium CG11_big_fil_rev_8_21_14_0_20_35_14 TaxID=1974634 RepID=A0A2H0N7I6_9BACT|nr:MAG: 30S ribosomal protein S13 [Candidatus Liptonbacteria bacterium CG11_big_fil_rev_8_21_14_0_20_35_14]